MIAPRFWTRRNPTFAARALAPLGALYGMTTARRMARPGTRVEAPVICVGNYVVGGAGKTPTAIAVARLLQHAGERVAFLSRGYGGQRRAAPTRVDPMLHGALAVGDEPLLLARVAPCWIGPDRVAAARQAIEDGASVLVLDDGLQNPALVKDYALAVIDGEFGFGNGLCFPAGPLRAPPELQAPCVSAEVTVGDPAEGVVWAAAVGAPRFRARLEPDAIVAAELIGRPVLAFAGIARPEKFFATLQAIGAIVAGRRSFPDHHLYDEREIAELAAAAQRRGLALVTTEKDYVRLAVHQRAGVRPLPVTLIFETPDEVAAGLAAALARRRLSARSEP